MTYWSAPFDLRKTAEYLEMGFQIVTCPVCGEETLDSHWVCRKCKWEYDGTVSENEYSACNRMTVAEYRKYNL